MLKRLDPKIDLSHTLLGELLLDHSGLSHTERMMVMTSTFNNLEFGRVAAALMKQHAFRESLHGNSRGKGKGMKGGKSIAFLANDDWMSTWEESEWYPDDEAWHVGTSSRDGWEAWHASTSSCDGWDAWDAWHQDDGYQDYSLLLSWHE